MKMLLIILVAMVALFIGLLLDSSDMVKWYGFLAVALSVLGAKFFEKQYRWLIPLAIVGIVVAVFILLGEKAATIAELLLILAMLIIILVQGEKKAPDIFLDLNLKDVGIFAENGGVAEPMPKSSSETESELEAEPEVAQAKVFFPTSENIEVGEEIVTVAAQYEGYPYVWGGSSLENGCDCSHFVWLILKKIGYIPPNADYYTTPKMKENEDTFISEWGLKKVESLESAISGDIVLYAHESNGQVHHVAFYNATTGCIIEAQGKLAGITTNRPVERKGQVIVGVYRVSGERYM